MDVAQLATGDWLMFMDDDNYAKPHELRTFVDVAHHTVRTLVAWMANPDL